MSTIYWIVGSISAMTLIVVWTKVVEWAAYEAAYKKGQIDALTGKIKYQLVDLEDGSKVWGKIDS